MKRKSLLAILLSTVVLCSCGNSAGTATVSKPTDNQSSSAETNVSETAAEEPSTSEPVTETQAAQQQIAIGDIISTENFEIAIKNIEFSYDVLPDNTSDFYTHYPADSGKVYIHVDTDVKNLQKQAVMCDSIMNISADYNDGYTYTGQAIPEDSNLGFNYANITSIDPLETHGVRFLIEVPEEVSTSDAALFLTFDVDGTKFNYAMR